MKIIFLQKKTGLFLERNFVWFKPSVLRVSYWNIAKEFLSFFWRLKNSNGVYTPTSISGS
jgi:hypothetical protein